MATKKAKQKEAPTPSQKTPVTAATVPVSPVAALSTKTPLQKLLETSDVLMMIYPKSRDEGYFKHDIIQEDERTIYKLVRLRNCKDELVICLDTGGGNVYAAVKIMDILRSKYKKITIAVMEEAKSSGTMMCLAADRVVMSYVSELGPLDKPMLHPSDETARISALDIVRSLDKIIDTAHDKQMELTKKITKKYTISKGKAVAIAGESIASLMSPLLSKQDVMIYNQALRLLNLSELYGKRFLDKYSLSWISTDSLRQKVVSLVMEKLIWSYPDHNFAICRDEVENELFLQVLHSEDTPYWNELWDKFDGMIDGKDKLIEFLV